MEEPNRRRILPFPMRYRPQVKERIRVITVQAQYIFKFLARFGEVILQVIGDCLLEKRGFFLSKRSPFAPPDNPQDIHNIITPDKNG